MTDEERILKNEQQYAEGVVRDFGYGNRVIEKIYRAKTPMEVTRVLTTARQEQMKKGY